MSFMDRREGKVSYVWEKVTWAIDSEELIQFQKEVIGPKGTEQGDIAAPTNGIGWECMIY